MAMDEEKKREIMEFVKGELRKKYVNVSSFFNLEEEYDEINDMIKCKCDFGEGEFLFRVNNNKKIFIRNRTGEFRKIKVPELYEKIDCFCSN